MKKNIKRILFTTLILILSISFVYADTDANIHLCEYSGMLRAMKIVGLLLEIVKIVIPLLLIILSVVDFGKAATSGNADDLKKNATIFGKRAIAGVIVFFLPSFINYLFNTLAPQGDAPYQACTKCLFDYKNCTIPDEENDPDVNK